MAETKPTPIPAIRRPATSRLSPAEAVCRMTPTMKIPQPMMIVVRRPMKSAKSPAAIDPKKVPAERMEVIRDFCHDGRVNLSSFGGGKSDFLRPVKRVMKYSMPMTPLM